MASVTSISSSSLEDLPEEFIRPENEQPRFTTFTGQLADVLVLDFGGPEDSDLVRRVVEAARQWGLFQIVNHGIANEVIEKLQRAGREFFELPQEEKEAYTRDPTSKSMEGYGSRLRDKDVKEARGWVDHLFNKIWPPAAIDHRFWPTNPPEYRASVEAYAEQLHQVVDKLLRCLSLGLGLAAEELRAAVGGAETVYNMKINYYPPCPRPELALGVPAHSDLCAVTILVPNEVQGLQMFKDGRWYDVAYIPNALIIHIGDQIEILSNGRYKAVLHRSTVNKEKTRLSWPVFIEPPPHLEIGPYPKLVSDENPPKYKTKKFSDYAYCKLNKIPQ